MAPAWLSGRTYFRRENAPEILDSNPLQEGIRAWTEFSRTSASSEGWPAQWETGPPGEEAGPP
jgi:hypothetical protein